MSGVTGELPRPLSCIKDTTMTVTVGSRTYIPGEVLPNEAERNNYGFGERSHFKGLAATLCAHSAIQSLMRMIICASADDPYPLQ